tara:strand:- start:1939 stop:2154 length:216 start_codon:yes stop_codon:yes gene_type:complete
MQTLIGLREIIREELGARNREDFDRFIRVGGELLEVRLARIDERLRSHGRLIGGIGAILTVLAGALAVLAD